MYSAGEKCGWCGIGLPEKGTDCWLVGEDKSGLEKPACMGCVKKYKPRIVRIEKP